jgi:hypothetical protein
VSAVRLVAPRSGVILGWRPVALVLSTSLRDLVVVKDLQSQVAQLVGAQDDLRRQLREAEEELEASRRLNRTLIRERNSNAIEASGSGC